MNNQSQSPKCQSERLIELSEAISSSLKDPSVALLLKEKQSQKPQLRNAILNSHNTRINDFFTILEGRFPRHLPYPSRVVSNFRSIAQIDPSGARKDKYFVNNAANLNVIRAVTDAFRDLLANPLIQIQTKLRALEVFDTYLDQDPIFQIAFAPTPQYTRELRLDALIDYDCQKPRAMFVGNDQLEEKERMAKKNNKIVLKFCRKIRDLKPEVTSEWFSSDGAFAQLMDPTRPKSGIADQYFSHRGSSIGKLKEMRRALKSASRGKPSFMTSVREAPANLSQTFFEDQHRQTAELVVSTPKSPFDYSREILDVRTPDMQRMTQHKSEVLLPRHARQQSANTHRHSALFHERTYSPENHKMSTRKRMRQIYGQSDTYKMLDQFFASSHRLPQESMVQSTSFSRCNEKKHRMMSSTALLSGPSQTNSQGQTQDTRGGRLNILDTGKDLQSLEEVAIQCSLKADAESSVIGPPQLHQTQPSAGNNLGSGFLVDSMGGQEQHDPNEPLSPCLPPPTQMDDPSIQKVSTCNGEGDYSDKFDNGEEDPAYEDDFDELSPADSAKQNGSAVEKAGSSSEYSNQFQESNEQKRSSQSSGAPEFVKLHRLEKKNKAARQALAKPKSEHLEQTLDKPNAPNEGEKQSEDPSFNSAVETLRATANLKGILASDPKRASIYSTFLPARKEQKELINSLAEQVRLLSSEVKVLSKKVESQTIKLQDESEADLRKRLLEEIDPKIRFIEGIVRKKTIMQDTSITDLKDDFKELKKEISKQTDAAATRARAGVDSKLAALEKLLREEISKVRSFVGEETKRALKDQAKLQCLKKGADKGAFEMSEGQLDDLKSEMEASHRALDEKLSALKGDLQQELKTKIESLAEKAETGLATSETVSQMKMRIEALEQASEKVGNLNPEVIRQLESKVEELIRSKYPQTTAGGVSGADEKGKQIQAPQPLEALYGENQTKTDGQGLAQDVTGDDFYLASPLLPKGESADEKPLYLENDIDKELDESPVQDSGQKRHSEQSREQAAPADVFGFDHGVPSGLSAKSDKKESDKEPSSDKPFGDDEYEDLKPAATSDHSVAKASTKLEEAVERPSRDLKDLEERLTKMIEGKLELASFAIEENLRSKPSTMLPLTGDNPFEAKQRRLDAREQNEQVQALQEQIGKLRVMIEDGKSSLTQFGHLEHVFHAQVQGIFTSLFLSKFGARFHAKSSLHDDWDILARICQGGYLTKFTIEHIKDWRENRVVSFQLRGTSVHAIKQVCSAFFEKWVKQNPLDLDYEQGNLEILESNIGVSREYLRKVAALKHGTPTYDQEIIELSKIPKRKALKPYKASTFCRASHNSAVVLEIIYQLTQLNQDAQTGFKESPGSIEQGLKLLYILEALTFNNFNLSLLARARSVELLSEILLSMNKLHEDTLVELDRMRSESGEHSGAATPTQSTLTSRLPSFFDEFREALLMCLVSLLRLKECQMEFLNDIDRKEKRNCRFIKLLMMIRNSVDVYAHKDADQEAKGSMQFVVRALVITSILTRQLLSSREGFSKVTKLFKEIGPFCDGNLALAKDNLSWALQLLQAKCLIEREGEIPSKKSFQAFLEEFFEDQDQDSQFAKLEDGLKKVSKSDTRANLIAQLVILSDKYYRSGNFIHLPFLADFKLEAVVKENAKKLREVQKKHAIVLQAYESPKLTHLERLEEEVASESEETESDMNTTDSNDSVNRMLEQRVEREKKKGFINTLLAEHQEETTKLERREEKLRKVEEHKAVLSRELKEMETECEMSRQAVSLLKELQAKIKPKIAKTRDEEVKENFDEDDCSQSPLGSSPESFQNSSNPSAEPESSESEN